MRELKFRMFDGSKMIPVGDITFFADGGYHVNEEFPLPSEQYKLMQFTGLKDKHGTEICEDDVVRYTNPHSLNTYTHLVLWDELFAGFGLFEEGNKWCQESDWLKICDVEVIGNIHQSPELLARKKKEV